MVDETGAQAPWRERLRVLIFEADTPAGKAFDVALLIAIVASVSVVMAESYAPFRERYGHSVLVGHDDDPGTFPEFDPGGTAQIEVGPEHGDGYTAGDG